MSSLITTNNLLHRQINKQRLDILFFGSPLGQLFTSYGLMPDSGSSTDTTKFNMADSEFPSAVDAIGAIAVQIEN